MSFNKVIILGNQCRDLELRYTPKGTAVVQFSLATNRKWKDDGGTEHEEVCFVECSCFGRTAEVVAQYQKKGDPLLVEGRLQLDQWEDKQTGQKRSKLKVAVERFTFVGGSKGGGQRSAVDQGESAAEEAQPDAEDDVPF